MKKKLKYIGRVRDYVKEFSSLMFNIKNKSNEDKLFNFMSGLKPLTTHTTSLKCVDIHAANVERIGWAAKGRIRRTRRHMAVAQMRVGVVHKCAS